MNNWNRYWHCDFSFADYCTSLVRTELKLKERYRLRKILPSHKINISAPQTFGKGKHTDFRSVLRGESVLVCLYEMGKASTLVSCIVTAQNWCGRQTNEKNKSGLLFFHESSTFIETISGCQTSTRTHTQNGEKQKKYLMVLKGSWKSRMSP